MRPLRDPTSTKGFSVDADIHLAHVVNAEARLQSVLLLGAVAAVVVVGVISWRWAKR